MAHTPGPWSASEGYNYNAVSIFDITDGKRTFPIAEAKGWRFDMNGGRPSKSETRANALLIAAAPEMLQALKDIDALWSEPQSSFSTLRYDGPDDPEAVEYFTPRMIATWKAIRCAIAKAEGRA